MITILGYDGTTVATLALAEITPWLSQAGARIWVNVPDPTPAEDKQVREAFSLPLLTVDDGPIAAAYLHPTPRFIIGQFPLASRQTLTFYLGRQLLVTSHNGDLLPLRDLWHMYQQDLSRWPYGLDYLLYQLCAAEMVLPQPAAADIHAALSPLLPASTIPLSHHQHQLHTWLYHLQQWHKLVQHLAQEKHELLDANTRHGFQNLAHHIQAETEKVRLWQGWLSAQQQNQQEQEAQRTQQHLNRLFRVGILLILAVLLAITLSLSGF